jgi:hypothetical protein
MTLEEAEIWCVQRHEEFHAWIREHFNRVPKSRCYWQAKVQRTEKEWKKFLVDAGMLDQFTSTQEFETRHFAAEQAFYVYKNFRSEDNFVYEPIDGMMISFSGFMTYC